MLLIAEAYENIFSYTYLQEQYQAKYQQLEGQSDSVGKRIESYKDPLEEIRRKSENFGMDIVERFFEGNKNKRRSIVNAVGSNLFVKEKKVQLVVYPWVEFLSSAPDELKEEIAKFEPLKGPMFLDQIGALFERNLTWGG